MAVSVVDLGLCASEVLSASPGPTMDLMVPDTGPVKVAAPVMARYFSLLSLKVHPRYLFDGVKSQRKAVQSHNNIE